MYKKFLLISILSLSKINTAIDNINFSRLPENTIAYSLEFLSGDDIALSYLSRFYSISPNTAKAIAKKLLNNTFNWPQNNQEIKDLLKKHYNIFKFKTPNDKVNNSKKCIKYYLKKILKQSKYQVALTSLDFKKLNLYINQDYRKNIELYYNYFINDKKLSKNLNLSQLLIIYCSCLNYVNIIDSLKEIIEFDQHPLVKNKFINCYKYKNYKFYLYGLFFLFIISSKVLPLSSAWLIFMPLFLLGEFMVKPNDEKMARWTYFENIIKRNNLISLYNKANQLKNTIVKNLQSKLKQEIEFAVKFSDKVKIKDIINIYDKIKNSYLIVFNFICYAETREKNILKNYIFNKRKFYSRNLKDNLKDTISGQDLNKIAQKYKFKDMLLLKELLIWSNIWNLDTETYIKTCINY